LFNFTEREKMKLTRNKILAILIMALLSTAAFFTVSMFTISTSRGATQAAINTSILNGLLYLNSTQAPNGEWSAGQYPVASTAMAVLAYENGGHFGWNASDPFSSTVQNGLNWIISQGQNITIGEQTAGNPDTSRTGIGIEWMGDDYPTYETSMALLAIIGSDAKTNVTLPGPLGVRTYLAIARDTVDYLCWAQTDPVLNSTGGNTNVYAGGWSYQANNNNSYGAESDQSNTGWPVFALAGAELWGIYPPAWVLNELSNWIKYDQDLTSSQTTTTLYGSFGYDERDYMLGQVSEAAVGIEELTLEGALSTNSSIVAAEGNMNLMWTYNGGYGSWDVNMGNLYAMYNVMRACRDAVPPIQYISYYNGTNGVEWYNGTGEYADQILAAQGGDGSWTSGGWADWAGHAYNYYSPALTTAIAVLILEPYVVNIATLYTLTVTVQDAQTLSSISGATVTAVGPKTLTGTTGSNGKITFSGVQAGSYAVTVTYAGYSSSSTVSVSVTSNTNYAVNLVSNAPTTTPIPELHVVVKSPSGYSVTVGAGTSVTLTAYVSGGTSPYCYQWVLYQSPSSSLNSYISGAVLSTLHVSQTTPGTYYYFVIIFDANGNVAASNRITLTVTSSSATSTPTSTSPTTMPTTTPVVTPAPTATPFAFTSVDWILVIVVIIILLLLLFLILAWYRRRRNLTVTVQDSQTLSPISGASVLASGPKPLSGTTGSNGQIVFSNVQAGTYSIKASATGYNTSTPVPVSVVNKTNYVVKLDSTAPKT
jgi:hypothetical protein